MFLKTLIFAILSITVVQSTSTLNDLHSPDKLPCIAKLESYKATTEHIKQKNHALYEEYKTLKLNQNLLKQLKKYHSYFEDQISNVLTNYTTYIEAIQLISNNDERLKVCRKYFKLSSKQNQQLVKFTKDMKNSVIEALKLDSALPEGLIQKIEKEILRILNIIIVVDLSYKIGIGALNFWQWANKVEAGIPSEEALIFREADVGELAERLDEVIAEEFGPEEIGTEASEALRNGVTEYLQSIQSSEGAAAVVEASNAGDVVEASAIGVEGSEGAAIAAEGTGIAEATGIAEGAAVATGEGAAIAGVGSLAGPIAIGGITAISEAKENLPLAKNLAIDTATGNTAGFGKHLLWLVFNMLRF